MAADTNNSAPREKITPEQNAEYNEIRTELAEQLDAAKAYKYSNSFLNHYETKKPNDYAALKILTDTPNLEKEALNTELVKLDAELAKLDGVRRKTEFTRIFTENGVNPASIEIDPDTNLLVATVDCPGCASLNIVQTGQDSFKVDGVLYRTDIEEVLEDVKIIVEAFGKIASNNIVPSQDAKFTLSPHGILYFDKKPLHIDLLNTFEAADSTALVKMLNERYDKYVKQEPDEEEPVTESEAWIASTIRTVDGEVPAINSEAEFLASIQGEEYNRLATLSGDDNGGSLVINISEKNSPDYLYSRIHHFLGMEGAVKNLTNPADYTVTINGVVAEWKNTTAYPSGTWVETGTANRILVKEGETKIEWTKKEAPVVAAAAEASVAPEVIVTNLEQEKAKIESLDAAAKGLLAREAALGLDETAAQTAWLNAHAAKKGLFQTQSKYEENLASATLAYDEKIVGINTRKTSLANEYSKLNTALFAVHPDVFEEQNGYQNTLAIANGLVSLRDGSDTGDSLETRIASLNAPTEAPATNPTAPAEDTTVASAEPVVKEKPAEKAA